MRLKITGFYFLAGIIILFLSGYVIETLISRSLETWLINIENINPGDIAGLNNHLTDVIWLVRWFSVGLLVLAAYVIAGLALRPIRHALETQKRFMRNAAHEFRTPLTVIKTNSEAALIDPESLTKQEAIETIKENLKEVDRITNTLRTLQVLSGYQNRLDDIILEEVRLCDSAAKVLKHLQATAGHKKLKLSLLGDSSLAVLGNAPAIEEMLTNLVKNSITYTPEGGKITINVSANTEYILLSVTDTGMGIPPDELPHIFEPMFRGSSVAVVKERRGNGLGLSLVKEIARLHKANVDVQSELGKGTTFSIRFPITN